MFFDHLVVPKLECSQKKKSGTILLYVQVILFPETLSITFLAIDNLFIESSFVYLVTSQEQKKNYFVVSSTISYDSREEMFLANVLR